MNSGILDINGIEIKAGDTVIMRIKFMHVTKPQESIRKVVFERAAFRFKNDIERYQSCIGDISHNVTLEVIDKGEG